MRRVTSRIATLVLALALAAAPAAEAQRRPRREPPDIARFRARVEAILSGAHPDATRAARERAARGSAPEDALAAEEVARRIRAGHWSLLVADAATGEVLFARHPASYFTPASNTKLFTTALAMAVLGPDFRFRTTVEARGALDARGRLRGELALVGRGDPSLSNRVYPFEKEVVRDGPPEKILAALADRAVAAGLREVEGEIVADASWLPCERYPAGWAVSDMTAGYGAPVSALTLHDNALEVAVAPGMAIGQPAWFAVEPWAAFYEFINELETVAAGGPRRLRALREPGSRRVVLRGTVPADAEPVSFPLAVEEPGEHAAALFARLLEQRGVRHYGRVRVRCAPEAPPPAVPRVLAEHLSPPLAELVALVNKISQNLHAELLLRAAARERTGDGSLAAATRLRDDWLASIGLRADDVQLRDGSGLARHSLLTPQATVALLAWVARQPWAEQYIAGLPVAGVDGTLAERMRETVAAGRIHAKTGTLANSNALSGFATTASGRRLVFSMFGNLHALSGRDATGVLDALCLAMVEEIGQPRRR